MSLPLAEKIKNITVFNCLNINTIGILNNYYNCISKYEYTASMLPWAIIDRLVIKC